MTWPDVMALKTQQAADERRFSCTIGTDDSNDLIGPDIKIDFVEYHAAGNSQRHIPGAEDRIGDHQHATPPVRMQHRVP